MIRKAGWIICVVNRKAPHEETKTNERFSDQFTFGPSINFGVFSIPPDQNQLKRLLELKSNKSFQFETVMLEQGFLNEVFRNKWLEIDFEYNANLWVNSAPKDYWTQREKKISVIH